MEGHGAKRTSCRSAPNLNEQEEREPTTLNTSIQKSPKSQQPEKSDSHMTRRYAVPRRRGRLKPELLEDASPARPRASKGEERRRGDQSLSDAKTVDRASSSAGHETRQPNCDLLGEIMKKSATAPTVHLHRTPDKRARSDVPIGDGVAKKPRRNLSDILLGKLVDVMASRAGSVKPPSSQAPRAERKLADAGQEQHKDAASSVRKTDPQPSRQERREAAPERIAGPRQPRDIAVASTSKGDDRAKVRLGKRPNYSSQAVVAVATASCEPDVHHRREAVSQPASPLKRLPWQSLAESACASGYSSCTVAPNAQAPGEEACQDEDMEDLSEVISQSINQCAPTFKPEGTYLVTDTNVFISHLDLLSKVANAEAGLEGYVICIPWVVIQELDNIKNRKKGAVTRQATSAILFIFRALSSNNPRVRGQSIAEARTKENALPKDGFALNDDHLLHCCLSLKEQGCQAVLLLSNDMNLRNKAMINSIRTVSAMDLEKNLESNLRQSTPVVGRLESAETSEPLSGVACLLPEDRIDEVRAILKSSLTLVLESELQSAFGDLWLHVVAVKPPWTEVTVLECLLRHWIALTGMAYKKSLKPVIERLLYLLKRSNEKLSNEMGDLLALSVELCSELQLHYYQLAEKVSRLNAIRQLSSQSSHQASQEGVSTSTGASVPVQKLPPRANIPPRTSLSSASLATVPTTPSPMLLFQETWGLVNDYCGTLCQKVGMSHQFPFTERPELLVDKVAMNEVYKHVVHAMDHMMAIVSRTKPGLTHGEVGLLVATLKKLLKLLQPKGAEHSAASATTVEDMLAFFSNAANKEVLSVGHRQITILHNIIGACMLKMISTNKACSKSPH